MAKTIGIDLGTTNCCVAALTDNKANVITDEKGNKTFPSYLTIMKNNVLVGHAAKAQVISNPYQTIFGVKRLIGHSFESQPVQDAINYFPYEIKKASDGGVLVVTEGREMSPEEASSHLLRMIKEIAEVHLEDRVEKAVITVPAYFNSQQRAKTKRSAELAELEVLRLVNEPTAAALAYGFNKQLDKRVLVFDLGGGTFDVAILDIGDNVYEVLASSGDSYLGGIDFDYRLVDLISSKFADSVGSALALDPIGMQRLKDAAEQAKCELSFKNDTRVLLPAIVEKTNLDITLTRDELEESVSDLLDRTFSMIEATMNQATLSPQQIDEVILVGGQTRMPKLQERIQQFFGKPALKGVHPDEAVAVGAAIHCEQLDTESDSDAADDFFEEFEEYKKQPNTEKTVVEGVTDQPSLNVTSPQMDAPSPTSSENPSVAAKGPARKTDPPKKKKRKKKKAAALLVDVVSIPLGVDSAGDTFSTLINGNSTVPCSYSRVFTTTEDFQEEVRIIVRQGDEPKASMNSLLGEFVLQGIRKAKQMEPQIDVTFKIDSNGILNVTAKDLDTGKQQSIIINEFELGGGAPNAATAPKTQTDDMDSLFNP